MSRVIEPLREDRKFTSYVDEIYDTPASQRLGRVAILFWHGLGDCVQFKGLLEFLRQKYSPPHRSVSECVQIDILIQQGLGQKVVFPEGIEVKEAGDEYLKSLDYDAVFKIHFPVEVPGKTKSELCCELELGIEPMTIYHPLPVVSSKLIGIHLFNTALPGVFNIGEEAAKLVWNTVIKCGFVPIELAFMHPYHNPKNNKFDFIDCTVRSAKATVDSLLSILGLCVGFIGVPSGPLHCAIAMNKPILYLEKGVSIDRFIHRESIVSLKEDELTGADIEQWLNGLAVSHTVEPIESSYTNNVNTQYQVIGSPFGV